MTPRRSQTLAARTAHRLTRYTRHPDGGYEPVLIREWLARRTEGKPAPFKSYPSLPILALTPELPKSGVTVMQALMGAARPARRAPAEGRGLGLAEVARLLFHGAGVVRIMPGGEREERRWFRAAGSAHSLSPLEVYLVAGQVDGLTPGVYHYDPLRHGLVSLRTGDHRARVARALAQDRCHGAYLILTGVPWRTVWRDGIRGFRNLYLDAGSMVANLTASAAASPATRASLHVGFVDDEVIDLLGVEGDHEFPLVVIGLGARHYPPPSRSALGPVPGPLVGAARLCPGVTAAQRTADLSSQAAVREWRRSGRTAGSFLEFADRQTETPRSRGPRFDDVVLRRSSTRRFTGRQVTSSILDDGVPVAARTIPSDASAPGAGLLGHSVVVHAVDGMAPGRYALDRGRWQATSLGDFRDRCTELSMGQRLAGDAGVVAYHGANVQGVTAALGHRGYRAALLEAGTTSGRLQLAAFGMGLGATALVCFDDEVRTFLADGRDPILVTAVGWPAFPAKPGGTPLRPTLLRRIPAPLRIAPPTLAEG